MDTISAILRARAEDDTTGLRLEDETWTWREHVAASSARAAWLADRRQAGPFHVGLLMDNVPEFSLMLGATALAGATAVGLNTSRSAAQIADDAAQTDCQLVLVDAARGEQAAALRLPADRIVRVDTDAFREQVAAHEGAALPDAADDPAAGDPFMLIFTSGTSGTPKAAVCSHGKIAFSGVMLASMIELTGEDVAYCSMPLFHSNAIIAGWCAPMAVGAEIVMRPRFSASAFVDDVRRFGATYANYVGKPLSYVLQASPGDEQVDTPLRVVFGNEASESDISRFAERFDCRVVDGYGSTELGISLTRTDETPPGSLGVPVGNVAILDPATGEECPPAEFDERGRLTNADAAVGEMVNLDGAGGFEGYYNNPEAERERMRGGRFHSGDLAYRDAQGFIYFAGRTSDWLRVDGENLAAAPIERMIGQHPQVTTAAVYAVPDPAAGDRLMVSLLWDGEFDPDAFDAWLADQPDFSPISSPAFVRVADELPQTPTNKVRKRDLVAEGWRTSDPVWWRPRRGEALRPLTDEDRAALGAEFAEHQREHLLPA